MDLLYQNMVGESARVFPEVKPVQLFKLPIKCIDSNFKKEQDLYQIMNHNVSSLLEANRILQNLVNSFTRHLAAIGDFHKTPDNLVNWHVLDFKSFLKELRKAKVALSLAQEAEWLSYFTEQKAKAQALQAQIAKTDKEIDALVYKLYGLTEEEIAVVEGK